MIWGNCRCSEWLISRPPTIISMLRLEFERSLSRPHQCQAIHSVHTSSRQYTASSLTYTWENVAGPKCSTDLFVLYNSEIICCHILLAYMNIGGGLEATLESRKVRQASFIHSFCSLQVHSLFPSEFSTHCDLVLPLSISSIFSFP